MKYYAKWWAILFSFKEGVILEFFTPTKITILESHKKIIVSKRDYNMITVNSTTFWIKDIRSFQLQKTFLGYNIYIRSRGNNIMCKGFSEKDALKIQSYINNLQ